MPGLIHHLDLDRHGLDRREAGHLLRSGHLQRLGEWLVGPNADPRILPFLHHRLRPTCTDAASLHDLWVPLNMRPHAFRPRCSRRSTLFAGTRISPIRASGSTPAPSAPVLHGPVLRAWPDHAPVPALPLVLEHAARCLTRSNAAIIIESALHQGRLTQQDLASLLARLPVRLRDPLRRVDGRAESGTETAVRWWLESLGVPVTPQVVVPGVGRVDLLVGTSWVIECDSRQFHDTDDQYHRDRARDLALRARGYTVTRLTWEQVFLRWGETKAMLHRIIGRRDHRQRLAR